MTIANLTKNIVGINGNKGEKWISNLPNTIKLCQDKWNLGEVINHNDLSFNYIGFTTLSDTDLVLKISYPSNDFFSELNALKTFNGNGIVRLIDYDDELCVMLLEHIKPGNTLDSVGDDKKEVSIACKVMKNMWTKYDGDYEFITTNYWAKGLIRLRERFNGTSGPFPDYLVIKAEKYFEELYDSTEEFVLLHGDLHHYNIIKDDKDWIIIDPKGVVGEREYEISNYLRNNLDDKENPQLTLSNRINQFSKELNLDKARITKWGLAQTVLSAWWSYEDNSDDWKETLEIAEMLNNLDDSL